MTGQDNRSAARIWADYLIAQGYDVPGGAAQASNYARQMIAADYKPGEIQVIINDLTARKLELRKIPDVRASEVADVIWRLLPIWEARRAAPPETTTSTDQGHLAVILPPPKPETAEVKAGLYANFTGSDG